MSRPQRDPARPAASDALLARLFGKDPVVEPERRAVPREPPKPGRTRSDLVFAACGAVLGLSCALFPWYIFLNQEKFGPPQVTFSGVDVQPAADMTTASPVLPRSGDVEVRIVDAPRLELDNLPTGSVPQDSGGRTTPLDEQPFPEDSPAFKVVHASAGRAMIEDDSGIWVVQPGSTLPDRSVVKSIVRRNGQWALVTDTGKVLTATP